MKTSLLPRLPPDLPFSSWFFLITVPTLLCYFYT